MRVGKGGKKYRLCRDQELLETQFPKPFAHYFVPKKPTDNK